VIYADANVIIRLLEGDAATRAPLEARLLPHRGAVGFLHTSRLSWLECRVKPLRACDTKLLALYDAFFSSPEVEVREISRTVVEKATELRAALNVKTPDALHLASAIISGASAFLTGDKALQRCTEVLVEVL
jgi:predicted nucleic acid-binding protein